MQSPDASGPGRRGAVRAARRRVRRGLAALLVALGGALLPPLYRLYMAFVWRTSRIVDHGLAEGGHRILEEHGGAVALLWHEEVLSVAYGYPHLGFRALTLASRGDAGEIVTRVLEGCGFEVVRGGSSRKASRRSPLALRTAAERLHDREPALFGVTVDGSQGPRYRMKPGGLALAREAGRPVALVRTWYRRCWRLPTWDRTGVPLPWNEIHYYLRGPYAVPPDARGRERLEPLRRRLEAELAELALQSLRDTGQRPPAVLVSRAGARDAEPSTASPTTLPPAWGVPEEEP